MAYGTFAFGKKAGMLTPDSVNSLKNAISGLNAEQAALALSTRGLTTAQQNQVLVEAGLVASSDRISASFVKQALLTDGLDKEQQESILIKAGLMHEDSKLLLSGEAVSAQRLKQILIENGYQEEQAETLINSILQEGQNYKEALSWKVLGTKAKEAAIAMLHNPLTWIVAAIASVGLLVKGYDALIGKQEKLSRQKIEGLDEDISKLDEEIKTLEELQSKLEDAKGSRYELSQIQTELNDAIGETKGLLNGESKAWDVANAKLKANIELKKQQRKQAQQDRVDESKDLYDSNSMEIDWRMDLSGDKAREYAEALSWMNGKSFDEFYGSDEYNKLTNQQQSLLWEAVGFKNSYTEEWSNYWKEQIDTAYDVFEDTIANYDGTGGQDFIKGLISDMVQDGASLSEISDVVTQVINNQDMQDAINKYWESLVNPDINSEEALQAVKNIFDDIVAKNPALKDFFDNFYNGIVAGGKAATDTSSDVNKMTVSLSDLKDASDSIATLQTAFNELSEDGYITTETLSKIKEAVGDNIDNWDEYQQKLLTAKKDSAEFKQILSDLTYAIIENEFATNGLENATEEEVAAVLRENGVLNANEVAHGMVTRAKVEAALAAHDFSDTSEENAASLDQELEKLGLTETAIKSLVATYVAAQNSMTEAAKESVRARLLLTQAEFESISSPADALKLALSKDNSYIDGDAAATAAYMQALQQAQAYGAAKEKIQKILDELFNTSPKYPSDSNQDKPDKSDPTGAITNRIGADVEALERQGKAIDHQLEMLDAEKEYDKYVELTNKALDNRLKTIEASKTAQAELSKEAQKIRDKYKGVNVDSFFDADGDFTEAYNNYYDSLSEEKRESFTSDMQMIQTFKRAWFEYYDGIMALEKEVFDLRKELRDAHYDHLSYLIDELQRHADLEEKQAEKDKERYDYLIDKEQALLDIKKSKFDLENKLISAQREAEKALATSKIGSEYLDEETRKLVYNDDDYELEIGTIKEIFADVDEFTEEYVSKLNKLGEEEIYKAEEITAQYERRIAIKEKELEIVQAEVDLQKKQDALNNVLAEKNIRQIVDGKWVWTHDADKLRQATEDLADAKAQVEQLEREQEQLEYTNTLEARIGNWQLKQEAIDVAMEHLQERIDEFSLKLELLKDPLEDFGAIVSELTAELGGVSFDSSSTSKASSGSSSGRLGSVNPNADVGSVVKQMMNNSTMWHVSDSVTKAQLHATNQKLAASIGADYNPANGKYYQNGVPLYDGGGVLKGLGGIKATKEDEIVLSPNITSNILSPEKNALFDKFTDNLGTILGFDKLAAQQIPFNIPQPGLNLLDTAANRNTTVNYNMNGDFNVNNPDNSDEIMRKFLQFINQPSQK